MAHCLPKASFKRIAFLMIGVATFCAVYTRPAFADTANWLSPGVMAEVIDDPLAGTLRTMNHTEQCIEQRITVANLPTPVNSCVYQAKSFRLIATDLCSDILVRTCSSPRSLMAISTGSDPRFYRVDSMYGLYGNDRWLVTPDSNRLVWVEGGALEVIDDITNLLVPTEIGPMEEGYTTDGPIRFLWAPQGFNVSIPGAAMSMNGEWLVGTESTIGLFRMHLTDGSIRLLSRDTSFYEMSITNDGAFIVAADDARANVYQADGVCGKDSSVGWNIPSRPSEADSFTACPSRSVEDILKNSTLDHATATITSIRYPLFNEAGNTLQLLEKFDTNSQRWIRLSIPGNASVPGLTYLAIGDSYSSGEGDITDGSSHYLPGTESEGQCHLSDRSYPFLLRDYYAIPESSMKSVACSGAQVRADYSGNDVSYSGQDKRLEKRGLVDDALKAEQQKAINEFIPGEVKQVDFVEKYKPSIITLTGGGNDVGFGKILSYCASPNRGILSGNSTCEYAVQGSELNKLLYQSIDNQYNQNKHLIQEIQQVSPHSRVVVVGYPSFVAESTTGVFPSPSGFCNFNSGSLNNDEIRTINTAVGYMDAMLQTLAHNMGVSYVDTEDALVGGRICDGTLVTNQHYVNGIVDVGPANLASGYFDESFHPNASGNQKLADAIIASNVFESPQIPTSAQYSLPVDTTRTEQSSFIDKIKNVIGTPLRFFAEAHTFQGGSMVQLTLHSDDIELGMFKAQSDGSLSISLSSDILPPGEHVLLADGTGDDGYPVTYYQFVTLAESPEVPNSKESPKEINDISDHALAEGSIKEDVSKSSAMTDVVKIEPKDDSHTRNIRHQYDLLGKIIVIIGIITVIGGVVYHVKDKK